MSKPIFRAISLGATIAFRGRSWSHVIAIFSIAVASMFLVIAMALPGTVTERGIRDLDRQPRYDFSSSESEPYVLTDTRFLLIDGEPYTEFLVASGNSELDAVPPPPGLERLPKPGELFISPALEERNVVESSHSDTSAASTTQGIISEEGLRNPHELVAWRGVTPEEIRNTNSNKLALENFASSGGEYRAHGFGWQGKTIATSQIPSDHTIDSSVHGLLLTCALVAALPCLLAAATASSIVARRRKKVLASMISAGLSQRTASIISATEIGVMTTLGWVLGAVTAFIASPILNATLPAEAQWFNHDFHVLRAPVIIAGAAMIIANTVYAMRKTQRKNSNAKWSPFMFFLGLCVIAIASYYRHSLRAATLFLGLAGLAICILFFRHMLSFIISSSGKLLRRTGTLVPLLAGARLEEESTESARGPASVGLAVLAAALTAALIGQLITYEQTGNVSDEQRSNIVLTQTTQPQSLIESLNNNDSLNNNVTKQSNDQETSTAAGYDALLLAQDKEGNVYTECDKFASYSGIKIACDKDGTIDKSSIQLVVPNLVRSISKIVNSNPSAAPPDSTWYLAWEKETPGLIEAIHAAEPLAPIYSPSLAKAARIYSADQVASLYRVVSWWTVITCAIFAFVAAASTASHRRNLVATLGLVGVSAWQQRWVWILYSFIPLLASVLLGAIVAIVADTAMVHILDISDSMSWSSYTEPLNIALSITCILGSLYILIAMRAVRANPEVNDLRRD
ncbi:hypothetical protein [Corynebacterium sp. sy039]|uniref:hypothetical protein n=1 Tax=Corynebacterium sp. sy039 TaxID=2599641 RepID=UPI0011B71CB2|nr:hypothetical protein [Corynebacterium sp. sy039]QDZ42462.1 hypothetical protein FQV43_04260 [Corynebacterium sp. sy039]